MRNLAVLAALGFVLAGCSGGVAEAKGGTATGDAASTDENVARDKNGSTVVSDPTKIKTDTPGGYVIKPANPDDPKFKADPRLGGGN